MCHVVVAAARQDPERRIAADHPGRGQAHRPIAADDHHVGAVARRVGRQALDVIGLGQHMQVDLEPTSAQRIGQRVGVAPGPGGAEGMEPVLLVMGRGHPVLVGGDEGSVGE